MNLKHLLSDLSFFQIQVLDFADFNKICRWWKISVESIDYLFYLIKEEKKDTQTKYLYGDVIKRTKFVLFYAIQLY